ncbi:MULTISPECIES: hypothetical protein [Lysinibacillus]|uniref:hypothetical protein n=1 Tax=Lysinibacillus TaxID=400634 RepID=UPI00289F9B38|nr:MULTISPECIES: hypothetical protein [Lysinibacillus]MEA0564576.1 hypothetical protein [Lysinibacillus irui]
MDLKALIKSDIKFKKIWESSCKNHRVLYFQIDKDDNGIEAHFHPYGEDHPNFRRRIDLLYHKR